MRARAHRLVASIALGLALLAGTAHADSDPGTRTLRLRFAHGHALEAAGRWADALDRFEEVAREKLTPQVQFHIALCQDRLGRLVAAEQNYRHARDRARGRAPLVVKEADQRLWALEARIPRVQLSVIGESRGVTVLLDGVPVTPGGPIRVDPGPHVAIATREGVTVAAASFATQESRNKLVTLTVLPPR